MVFNCISVYYRLEDAVPYEPDNIVLDPSEKIELVHPAPESMRYTYSLIFNYNNTMRRIKNIELSIQDLKQRLHKTEAELRRMHRLFSSLGSVECGSYLREKERLLDSDRIRASEKLLKLQDELNSLEQLKPNFERLMKGMGQKWLDFDDCYFETSQIIGRILAQDSGSGTDGHKKMKLAHIVHRNVMVMHEILLQLLQDHGTAATQQLISSTPKFHLKSEEFKQDYTLFQLNFAQLFSDLKPSEICAVLVKQINKFSGNLCEILWPQQYNGLLIL